MTRSLWKSWWLTLALVRLCADSSKAPHWAFQPVRNPALPGVTNPAWCRSPIDRFILADLESRHVFPSRPADPRALLRRVTLDLTGLPPTARELDAFAADSSPEAFRRVVDRLLESPHYGEHWGRHWLDVVRYADTAGETADYPVPVAWRYRNYVIHAFNADKPYNEFLREQLAGDVLARRGPRDRYAERVTATGFLAISRRFGFDSENYHHLTLQDTIDTLGQSVMGLTLGCARCHAHKFDPVSMPDYYALYGIFDSTRFAFPGSEQKQRHRALAPLVPPAELEPAWRDFEYRVASLTARLEALNVSAPSAVLRSLDDLDGDFEMQAPAAGGSKGVLVPPWLCDGPISVTTEAQSPFRNLHPGGRVGVSIPEGTAPYWIRQRLNRTFALNGDGAWSVNLDLKVGTEAVGKASHRLRLMDASARPVVEVVWRSGSLVIVTGGRERAIRPLPPGRWCNLQLRVDSRSRMISAKAGWPGEPAAVDSIPISMPPDAAVVDVVFDSAVEGGGRLPSLALDNLAITSMPLTPVTLDRPPVATGEAAAVKAELERLLAEGPVDLVYGVTEGTPHDSPIQARGEPETPGELAPRAFPAAIGGRPISGASARSGSGRLELADWLVDPKHPLTARVMVNRIWQHHFGQGLVRTPNDFGLRGQPPTHPELLDYLATRFVQEGWSIKAMHRLILSSATYQQASVSTARPSETPGKAKPEDCPLVPAGGAAVAGASMAAADTGQVDYARFPRRRLGAEETRDAILRTSGELDDSPGRGHPFPAPTSWGFTQHGPFSAVYDHPHRSVYLMSQRLQRHPFLALFDGADPNATTPGRRTTTVPTQALYFLNDPFVHRCADRLAGRLLEGARAPQGDDVLRRASREIMGRSPTPAEAGRAREFLTEYRTELETTGAHGVAAERTALAAWIRVLYASNEFLTVD